MSLLCVCACLCACLTEREIWSPYNRYLPTESVTSTFSRNLVACKFQSFLCLAGISWKVRVLIWFKQNSATFVSRVAINVQFTSQMESQGTLFHMPAENI